MFTNMGLRAKLMGGFIIVAVFTCAVGIIGYWGVSRLAGDIREIGEVQLPSVHSLKEIKTQVISISKELAALTNPRATVQDRKQSLDNIGKAREKYQAAWKVYEPLPRETEEDQVWQQFKPAVDAWEETNNQFMNLANELNALGIENPVAIERDIQKFRGDHHVLMGKVQDLLLAGTTFEGGEDPTQCNFGKWLAQFRTDNPEIQRALSEIREFHQYFHHTVPVIREAVARNDKDAARKQFEEVMRTAATHTFEQFEPRSMPSSKRLSVLMTRCTINSRMLSNPNNKRRWNC
ncbi:MAG TPA: MCP four helix bundle domain-containing protein [Candidatus Hydrogenedentes bacterium]|nr:MCP four helix bundle domain-containing protein [Candidatus Hydrogenedentota bacterium]HOL76281.1 MCP four helix bundle domain-containing protein [Candidatus Hydrogenedentota bacterium]HPO86108.1 MCP four helix bundle domain-containing protein [Candidatus Hydrogenedentota bacterium]